MPTVDHEPLGQMVDGILRAMGANEEETQIVRRHMIGANLVGHDSHGVILLSTYVDRIKKGHIVPGAKFEIVREGPTTARINGNWGFGQVVSERAMQMAIDKAKTYEVGAVTVFHQSHVGRVGDYPLMAARAGFIGMMTADSGKTSKAVAPFGGRVARLGTNPICIALPSDLDGPIFIDMATSAVAAGKISLARNRKQQIPLGWIVDKEGHPTTNPLDYYAGGAILPVGGGWASASILTGPTTTACSWRSSPSRPSGPWMSSNAKWRTSSSTSRTLHWPRVSQRSYIPVKSNIAPSSSGVEMAFLLKRKPGGN
jgi:LDH2 family malate/lactate/ureidoglycolate dehydrogenase